MALNPKYLTAGETIVVSTRTHPKVLIGPVLLVLAAVALAAVVTALDLSGVLSLVLWILAALALVWFLAVPFLRWWTTSYTFTDERFMKRSGFVSQEGRTIPLNRISGVDFEIGVIDRIFGCGTLVVSDASQHGRVLINDIPRVEQVQLRVADELARMGGPQPGTTRTDDGA